MAAEAPCGPYEVAEQAIIAGMASVELNPFREIVEHFQARDGLSVNAPPEGARFTKLMFTSQS